MKFSVEAILDTPEPHFTKTGISKNWQAKPVIGWLLILTPDARLEPTEEYSLRLYLRSALTLGLAVDGFLVIGWLAPLGYLWNRYPRFLHRAIFHHGQAHALLIGLLASEGCYQMPVALMGLLLFPLMIWWPRRYFWNRRAARLRREEQDSPTAPAEPATTDMSRWPLAPNRPAS